MTDIKSTVIQAAIEVFSQYGVKKTSMSDIAERAGVSRQTLYVNFKNKDEMLAAAMQGVIGGIYENLESQWGSCDSVEEKLTAYFDIAIISTYDLLKSQPDSEDILRGVGELSSGVAKNADQKKVRMWTEQLQACEEKLEQAGTNPKAVAQFIVSTTVNLLYTASSRKELKALLQTLKHSVIALTQGK